MLTHLQINDFTLVDHLDLELSSGLTTITGETGAGKSIMLDALGLALGDKTDADKVRLGCEKTEIHATFDIAELPAAQQWLTDQDLRIDDDCILRRIITAEGRSRAYINGSNVPLQQLRVLGDMLADIHSQHEHQSLLKPSTHKRLLDDSAGLKPLATTVRQAYHDWHTAAQNLELAQNQSDEINARFQLLSYQVEELDQLNLQEDELEALEKEQRILANLETTQQNCSHVLDICSTDDIGIVDNLHRALHLLGELPDKSDFLSSAHSLLENAVIQVQEAQSELERQLENQELDQNRLPEVEQRLSQVYEISRKHKIHPSELVTLHQSLAEELQGMQSGDEHIQTLEETVKRTLNEYETHAQKLTKERKAAAKALTKSVNEQLAKLAMANATFAVELKDSGSEPTKDGNEVIEFLISTHPGQVPKALIKIASGGELSRISLAIQVVTAQTSATPTLVFDEVDVGIGGPTGDVVGRMLRELGQNAQVICVTHLAQVASKGHQHIKVSKEVDKQSISSQVTYLEGEEKIQEIARMMGGDISSKQSLAHAKQMVKSG